MSDTSIIVKCDDIVTNKGGLGEAVSELLHSTPENQYITTTAMLALLEKAGEPTKDKTKDKPRSFSTRLGDRQAAIQVELFWCWIKDAWHPKFNLSIIDNEQARRNADAYKRGAANSFWITLDKSSLAQLRDKLNEALEIWDKHTPTPEDAG